MHSDVTLKAALRLVLCGIIKLVSHIGYWGETDPWLP